MSIKLYKASSFKYTPFEDFIEGDLAFINENDIVIVDKIKEADIIISQNYKHLKKHFWRGVFGNKKFLIWTLESRFDTHFSSEIKVFFNLVNCHIMNVYTKDVFVTNVTFRSRLITNKLKLVPQDFKLKSKKVVALMSFYKGLNSEALIRDGDNIDLIKLRTEIALKGHEIDAMDVYGKGWPEGISKEDSREGNWVERKRQLVDNYHFNLSFENTAAYNYVTEKIWDSIENYCLPIYYGKHTNIYELFPENSFIDYSKFDSPEALFEFISQMTNETFIERMNNCIKVYNAICEKGSAFGVSERQKMLDNIVSRIKKIHKTK
ncbi:glycosyltransferase family 10 domain-containing protein [Pontimicrobium sp. MEBiC06410]